MGAGAVGPHLVQVAAPGPVTFTACRNRVAAKPVPQMMTSASWNRPSAVRTPGRLDAVDAGR